MENIFMNQVMTHAQALKNFAMSFTKNIDNAEDLVQDTMVKAVRYEQNFKEGTNLKAWLFTIMRNTFINDYRQMVRKSAVVLQEEDLSSVQLHASAHRNQANSKLVIEDIQKALKLVPKKARHAFVRYFEGYKYEEIAQELDIPLGTVKTLIHNARKILKKSLAMYDPK